MAVLILAVVAGALLLAACGSSGGSSSSGGGSTSSSSTSGSAPESGGGAELVNTTPAGSGPVESVSWDLPYGEPATLDYIEAAAFSENTVLSNVCESLIHLTPEFGYEPGLAKTYKEVSPTEYVYDLRPGLKFSDGDAVTAEDVVFSLERNRDAKLGSFWEPWFANVKSIVATGKDQVTVKLTKPDVMFNQFLATAAGVVAEKSFVEKAGKKFGTSEGGVMCVGPYKIDKWTPGKEISIVANPDYWGPQPQTKEIDFQFLTNQETTTQALETGEIDGAYEAPPSSWESLSSSSAGTAYAGNSTAYVSLSFTEKEGPVQEVDFRRAMEYLIDREAVAETIFHGAAEPIRSTFFPTTWGYAQSVYEKAYESLPDVQADPAEAEKLAGEVKGLKTVTMLTNADDAAAKQLAAYIQSQAKEVGIDIELKELPAAQYIADAFEPEGRNRYDMILSTTGYLDLAEPVEWGEIALSGGGVFNDFGYDDASVNKWVQEAREATDPTERAELMVKVQEQAYGKDVVEVPIVNSAERLFMNSSISGATPTLTPLLYAPWASELGAAG
jgi:peptide/nickel transport system substrate-binding protein